MAPRRLTLFCFPHAGAGALAYRGWQEGLGTDFLVRATDRPGHGKRFGEGIVADWPALVADAVRQLVAECEGRFALFGHSLGALLALEVAHALRERGRGEAAWLCVSGCVAPLRRSEEAGWLDRDDAQVIDQLRHLGGTADELLGDPDFMELALPRVRADFHLSSQYRRIERRPLAAPLLVLGGRRDPLTADRANLEDWAGETAVGTDVRLLDGGHFFVLQRSAEVFAHLIRMERKHRRFAPPSPANELADSPDGKPANGPMELA